MVLHVLEKDTFKHMKYKRLQYTERLRPDAVTLEEKMRMRHKVPNSK